MQFICSIHYTHTLIYIYIYIQTYGNFVVFAETNDNFMTKWQPRPAYENVLQPYTLIKNHSITDNNRLQKKDINNRKIPPQNRLPEWAISISEHYVFDLQRAGRWKQRTTSTTKRQATKPFGFLKSHGNERLLCVVVPPFN
jgi:hypothetical protein